MSTFAITLPSGVTWEPKFVTDINKEKCIGCGRCFKVCGRDVLQLMGMDDEGELIAVEVDGDDDDEYEKKVMTVGNAANCIGCESCAKICPKKCYTHQAVAA